MAGNLQDLNDRNTGVNLRIAMMMMQPHGSKLTEMCGWACF